mgnify:CR=1 FL=1
MVTFAEFRELRELLSHLYDPAYVPPAAMRQVLVNASQSGKDAIAALVARAIHDLKPAGDVPADSRAWRFYHILVLRYLEHLSQEEAAERLALSVRHLAREQAQAIELLAVRLWPGAVASPGIPDSVQIAEDSASTAALADPWRQQIEKEIASLQEHSTAIPIDLGKILRNAAAVVAVLATERGVSLRFGTVEPEIKVNVHSAIMRQILVAALTYLLRSMTGGWIDLSAEKTASHANISVAGTPFAGAPPPADWLGRELLASQGGGLSCVAQGESFALRISVPLARKVTVLVIDDNQDLVHLYRRCMAGTVYEAASVPVGSRAFESIEMVRPDVVVLDLMLPDVDGWELLAQLHEHPLSRGIPIVVCSVVREEELALALGAAVCLRKPVQCQQLIQALDQAMLSRAAAGDLPASDRSAASC